MENEKTRKIGERIGHVDSSRRPYASFVLGNPHVSTTDLAGYAALSCAVRHSDLLIPKYAELSLVLSEMVKNLPRDGPMLEDWDIVGYSHFEEVAQDSFMELKKMHGSKCKILSYSAHAGDPESTILIDLYGMHLLRDIPLDKQKKIFEKGAYRGLFRIGNSDSYDHLSINELQGVINLGKEWQSREGAKYNQLRKLQKVYGRGVEFARLLEQKAGFDYGGYLWSNEGQRHSEPGLTDGGHNVNVLTGKILLIQGLEKLLLKKENGK
ncbi:hypothetical protein FJZ21_03755 [Candidatus Pacearchaeota archaeon]|nr:hypothetical protein [Candidatus Pacearchaeota archaeon]